MVEVTDHGSGFDPAARRLVPTDEGGFGLFSIRERLDLMGGRVDVASSPGKGTRVTLTVPLKRAGGGPKAPGGRPKQSQVDPSVTSHTEASRPPPKNSGSRQSKSDVSARKVTYPTELGA
jgi:hypothetical protein